MTYLIKKTNGEDLAEILDSSIDVTATDLTLIGKNVTGYGEYLNGNFVKLLENFASTSEPTNPIVGQLWFDLSENRIKVYDGNGFTVASGPIVSPTSPLTPNQGDFWIDNNENQVYAYDGIDRILMGPIYKDSQGLSGFEVVTIKDDFSNTKTVTLLWNSANLLGIFSHYPEFTPVGISNYIGTIKPGFNVANVAGFKFNAVATVAEAILDDAGNYKTVNDFFLNNTGNTTTGSITILNPAPLTLGANQETNFVVSTSQSQIKNNVNGQDFLVTTKNANVYTDALTIKAISNRVGIFNNSPQAALDVGGSVIINGDLTVNGSTVSINTTEINLDDKSLTLANTLSPTDILADGGGLILKGSTDHTLLWSNANTSWNVSENFNIAAGKSYRINNIDVLSQSTLSSTITSALGLTQVGTLSSLQVDNINLNGSTITSSSILNLTGLAIDVNDLRILNVQIPALSTDAANKQYVDNNLEPAWTEISKDSTVGNKSRNLISTISGPVVIGLPEDPLPGDYLRFVDFDGTFDSNNLVVARYRKSLVASPNGVAVATGTFDDIAGLGLATTGGSGTGLTVRISVTSTGTYTSATTTVTPVKSGIGYQTGDVIVVSGALLGGATPANDLIFNLGVLDNILGQTDDLIVSTKNAAFGLVFSSASQGWTYLETLQFPPTIIADVIGNVVGNVTGDLVGNVIGNITGNLTGSVLTASQPNITDIGTLSSLDVSGSVTAVNFLGELTGDVTGTLFGSVTGSNVSSTTSLSLISNLGDIKLRAGANGIRLSAYDNAGTQEQYAVQVTPGAVAGNRNSILLFGDVSVENITSTNINGSSFKLPRYTTIQQNARTYTSLNYGELLYNTDTNKVQAYTSTGWVDLH